MQLNEVLTPKGHRILFINTPGNTAATVQVWFRAGSVLENQSNQGIAHFLEHMFFKGTKKRPGNKLADQVETFGGEINAFTSFDYTSYYINCPKSRIEDSVEILMDMISSPLFKNSDITPERQVVLEEYNRSLDSSSQFSFLKIQQECFTGDYQRSIIGTPETITNFSRQQLIDFKKQHYHQGNMLLVIAGDIASTKQLVEVVDRFSLGKGKASDYPPFVLGKKAGVHLHHKDTEMCQLTLTIQGPNYNSDQAPVEDLCINCLGHGETSHLFRGLVIDKTIANSASASTLYLADGSAHLIRINFPPENIDEVLNKLTTIFSGLMTKGLDQSEITKIQDQYIASKIYERESIESLAFTYGNSYIQTGDYYCEERFIEQMRKTNSLNASSALRSILKRPIHLSLQVPKHCPLPNFKLKLKNFGERLKKHHASKVCSMPTNKHAASAFDEQVQIKEIIPGITLLHRYNALTPTFAAQIYIKGGLTEETEDNNGIHNLMTSLLSRGHKNATYHQLQTYLEDHSASLYGFAGKNAYGMMLHGQTKDHKELFNHLFSSFFAPSFPTKELAHEKKLSLRALKAQQVDPVKHCFEAFNRLVFNQHPYSLNMLGTASSIKKISLPQIKKLHTSNLKHKEILISFCGDMSFEQVAQRVHELCKKMPARPYKKLVCKKVDAIHGKVINIPMKREQAHIMMGFAVKPLSAPENIYLKMLTAHFGGQSSELFSEVRDRLGLCYTAQPVYFSALEAGYWGIYLACGQDKIEASIAAIKNIVNRAAQNGIGEKDFLKIKSMIKGQNEMSLQTNEDYATTYSVPLLQGLGVDYFHLSAKAIEKVTYQQFQKEVKKLLSSDANIVIVRGDQER